MQITTELILINKLIRNVEIKDKQSFCPMKQTAGNVTDNK